MVFSGNCSLGYHHALVYLANRAHGSQEVLGFPGSRRFLGVRAFGCFPGFVDGGIHIAPDVLSAAIWLLQQPHLLSTYLEWKATDELLGEFQLLGDARVRYCYSNGRNIRRHTAGRPSVFNLT